MNNEQLWALINELLRTHAAPEIQPRASESEHERLAREDKAARMRAGDPPQPLLRLKHGGTIVRAGQDDEPGGPPARRRAPEDDELDMPFAVPHPPPPPVCQCRMIAIVTPNDEKDENEGGWGKRRRRREVSGGNVHSYVYVDGDTYDWTAVGFTDLILRHANPCPDCIGKAVFHYSASTAVEAVADTMSLFGLVGVSAEAVALTAVSRDLDYRAQAAVVPQTRVDSNLEIEINVPLPTGGTAKIKFKPELTRDSHAHAADAAGNHDRKEGDQASVRVWSRAESGASGGGTTLATASATARTLLAWVAYCDCPRHGGVRRQLIGSDGPDQNSGRELDMLLQLAESEPSLFTGLPPTRTEPEPPPAVGPMAGRKGACIVAVTIAGLDVVRNADRAGGITWRLTFETTIPVSGQAFTSYLATASDTGGGMSPDSGVILDPCRIGNGCGQVITLVVKIAAHGTRGDERFYGELDNVRLHFKCDRDLEEPRVRQQRIEIACEPFSIRAIVSSGDECGS